MTVLLGLIAQAVHVALMLAGAPLLAGLRDLAGARLLGQSGPHPLQPYRDMRRLLRKQPVLAENASWLFRAAPIAGFAVTATAAVLVPSFALGMPSAPLADLVVVAGLLTLARAIDALAAMDCGTSTGGLAARRSAWTAVVAEPAMLLVVLALAMLTGSTSIDATAGAMRDGPSGRSIQWAMAGLSVCLTVLATSDRIPALRAEYGGRLLALVQWTSTVRSLVLITLFTTVFIPFSTGDAGLPASWLLGIVGWTTKVVVLAAVTALADTVTVRRATTDQYRLLCVALLLALLAAVMLTLGQGAA